MVPNPKKIEHKHEEFGNVRLDNYYWMNERDSDDVISHLHSENAYCDEVMKDYKELEDDIFNEIVEKIVDNEESVPYTYKSYSYYYKFQDGKEYPNYFRKKDDIEEILLDVNLKSQEHEFFQVTGRNISPNENLYAYGTDTTGRRLYNIIVKDLTTGEEIDDKLESTNGWVTWRNDNRSFYYVKQDETLRDSAIYLHRIGESQDLDTLVFFEEDEEFTCSVFKSRDEKLIFIKSESTLSTEYRFTNNVELDNSTFKIIIKREKHHEYHLDYNDGSFFMLTNKDAINFKLVKFDIDTPDLVDVLIDHNDEVLLEDFEIFENFIVSNQRINGNLILSVLNLYNRESYFVEEDENAYTSELAINASPKSKVCRYVYTSLTTPETIIEFDMITKEKKVLKISEVKGDFCQDNYLSQRILVTSHDGVEVPVSLVYHKETNLSNTNPTLCYGYGSYGISSDPYFSISRLSLLDRGFIFAIIHARGGEEKGRLWYENGKLGQKTNTFLDFIAGTKELIKRGFTDSSKVFAYGGSAGGLLMGAIVNMEPELYKGVLAAVPFVDVLTTMLDDSIPLTTGEYNEWGNPNILEDYNNMRVYSPYDNIKECNFPNILVTTGYNDSQVQYWEPAKWVAKMRDYNIGNNKIIFKTDMNSGHSGASGRYEKYREVAFDYAFLISLVE